MATFVLRVALPDRPGALGLVASRIGAVRGDVVAVEVVERADGLAVDEFVVELADAENVPLLVSEIEEVDGSTVEEVHPLLEGARDRRLDAYQIAAALLSERSPDRMLVELAVLARRELDATWAAVVDTEDGAVLSSAGRPPAAAWVRNMVVQHTGGRDLDGADMAWVELAAWDLMLVTGRPGWRFGDRERLRLAAIARLADTRWLDLAERDARTSHPSRAG